MVDPTKSLYEDSNSKETITQEVMASDDATIGNITQVGRKEIIRGFRRFWQRLVFGLRNHRDEKIEQNINASGSAKTGDITQIGKLFQFIFRPALWQDETWKFIKENKYFVGLTILLQVAFLVPFLSYKNLYLIPWWLWGLTALMLPISVWNWYAWKRQIELRSHLNFALMATVFLTIIIGWQGWQIAFPQRFEPEVLGIVLAELGGANYQRSKDAQNISDQIYYRLCQTIEDNFGDSCGDIAQSKRIAVQQVGIIPNAKTAANYGGRLGAEIVIWGQYISDQRGAIIRYQILETLETAVTPNFPTVLPVTTTSADITLHDIDLSSEELKVVIAEQSTVLSAFTLGLLAYHDHDFPQAVLQLTTAVEILDKSSVLVIPDEGKSLLYLYLGKANIQIGQLDEGEKWLKRATQINSEEPAVFLHLGNIYQVWGQDEDADQFLDQAQLLLTNWLTTHENDKTAIYNQGAIYQMTDQLELASIRFQDATKIDPEFYIAYISLGQTQAMLGQFDAAASSLQDAIELAKETGANPSWAYLILADIYRQSGKPEMATNAYLQAIELEPEIDIMYFEYAQFLEQQQDIVTASQYYEQMVRVSKRKGWAYDQLASFQKEHEMLPNAAQNFQHAIAAQPHNPDLRVKLAETYYKLEQFEKARQEFETAVNIGSNNYYIYASYAYHLVMQAEWEQAAIMYEQSIALRPGDCDSLENLGRIYQILEQPDNAIKTYRKLLDIIVNCQNPEEVGRFVEEQLHALGVGK